MLVLAACTAPNLAYQAFDDAEVGSTTDDTATEGADSEGADSESTEPGECIMHPARPLRITVEQEQGEMIVPWEPECPDGAGTKIDIDFGNDAYPFGQGVIEHLVCSTCPCPGTSPLVRIDMGADIAFADDVGLPGCTRISLWTRMGASGCEWAGVVVTAMGSALPAYIASNELAVPPLAFVADQPLTLGLEDEAACTDRDVCDGERHPGRYALDVLGQAIVPVDDPPRDIDIALVEGAPTETYIFDNRESSVSLDCAPQVSWTAQLRPPPPM